MSGGLDQAGLPWYSTAGTNGQLPPPRHGLNGIDDQISHGSQQVLRVGTHLGERGRELLDDGDAALRRLLFIESHATGDDLMDIERPRRNPRRTTQLEQILHDRVDAIDLFGNNVLEAGDKRWV